VTASWIVEGVNRVASLREGCGKEEAIDTVWLLMDPAVFDRLTRRRKWTPEHYERWFSRSVDRLLTADAAATGH
jgi:hypothetical protein